MRQRLTPLHCLSFVLSLSLTDPLITLTASRANKSSAPLLLPLLLKCYKSTSTLPRSVTVTAVRFPDSHADHLSLLGHRQIRRLELVPSSEHQKPRERLIALGTCVSPTSCTNSSSSTCTVSPAVNNEVISREFPSWSHAEAANSHGISLGTMAITQTAPSRSLCPAGWLSGSSDGQSGRTA